MNELRRDRLSGEWVIVAPNRASRPVSPEMCPFCPGAPEIDARKEVQILRNRYPPLSLDVSPAKGVDSAPARGVSEIVIESRKHDDDLAYMSEDQALIVFDVALSRMRELSEKEGVEYVHFFRNRGGKQGVTVSHPHSQVYALPFVPKRLQLEQRAFRSKACPVCSVELTASARCVFSDVNATAYVPYAPRWPYEVHVVSSHTPELWEISEKELSSFVRAIRFSMLTIDRLFGPLTPVTLTLHNSPKPRANFHAHAELIPAFTDRSRVRFSTGLERSADTHLLDLLPEEMAATLRGAANSCQAQTFNS